MAMADIVVEGSRHNLAVVLPLVAEEHSWSMMLVEATRRLHVQVLRRPLPE